MLSPLLSAENNDSQICFSQNEWNEFETKVSTIIEETAQEAVAEAVKPLLVEIAGLKEERDFYEDWGTESVIQLEEANREIKTLNTRIFRTTIVAIVISGASVILGLIGVIVGGI